MAISSDTVKEVFPQEAGEEVMPIWIMTTTTTLPSSSLRLRLGSIGTIITIMIPAVLTILMPTIVVATVATIAIVHLGQVAAAGLTATIDNGDNMIAKFSRLYGCLAILTAVPAGVHGAMCNVTHVGIETEMRING
jgi:hypothetical protein